MRIIFPCPFNCFGIIQPLRKAWRGERVVDFIMKRYGNYTEGEGYKVIPLCNAGKQFHMTDLSAAVAFCTLCALLCGK